MTATQLMTRALGLADLKNSKFITWNDKAQSLFETNRDIYSTYVDNDNDYFLTTTTIAVTAADLSPTSTGTLNEYLVPLPSDCMRLRFVQYQGTGNWQMIPKFQIDDMDIQGYPYRYRWQNQNLWLIGSSTVGLSNIRVGYYPKQPIATVPDDDLSYGNSITLANRGLVTYPAWTDQDNSLLYVYNGTKIQIDSDSLETYSTVLYTGAGTITYLCYYAGYIYFLMSNAVYRAPYLQTGTIVPTSINSAHTYTSFSVSTADRKIYASDGSNIYSMGLDGSGIATYQTFAGVNVYNFSGLFGIYVDGSGNLKTTAGTTLTTGVSWAGTDGTTFIFYLTTGGVLYSAQYSTTDDALTSATILRSDITTMGPYFASGYVYPGTIPSVMTGRIPTIDYTQNMLAISSVVDYDFSYPTNDAWEIISYQCAIDFRRKQNADITLLQGRLGMKGREAPDGNATGIWGRFENSIQRRDDYRPERVGNIYRRGWLI